MRTTPGTHQLDIAATNPALDSCYGPETELYREGGSSSLGSASPDPNRISHIRYTLTGADRFLIRVSDDCVGGHWQFRIDPPEAVSATAPAPVVDVFSPGPSAACLKARSRVRHYLKKQRSIKRQLRHARGRKARKLRRKLRVTRRHLRKAVQSRRLNCQTP